MQYERERAMDMNLIQLAWMSAVLVASVALVLLTWADADRIRDGE
jgi:hypothetical protein